ncbi:unnamed protein product [Closterium sp. Yama58-4]|nr:unnamed protein product [Closterium sp. Yama58-4]
MTLFAGKGRPGWKGARLIGKFGLEHLARLCPHLEHLSLEWLDSSAKPPDSLFQLPLRTLVLNNKADLTIPKVRSLSPSLTALCSGTSFLDYDQLSTILRLTNLTRLSLSKTIRFPRSRDVALAQLPSLESLEVKLFDSLTDIFLPNFQYRSLKRLQLTSGYGEERFPNSFAELLPCLQELSISNCKNISDWTDQFTSFTCLESLTISGCNVSLLPENMGDLPALKTLVLDESRLCRLPASFTSLTSLETLLVLHFLWDDLPAGLGCLTALRTLSLVCSRSPNLDLQEDLVGLTSLQTFRLQQYLREQLPPSFTQLASLTRLELDECSLVGLPEGVGTMARLQELCIHACPDITGITESVTNLVNLRVLIIDKCPHFSSLPRRLDSLTSLTQLEVRGCELLNEAPQALPLRLQTLIFKNKQQMVSLPDLATLTELRKLCLGIVGAECVEDIGGHLSGLEHLEVQLVLGGEGAEETLSALTRLSCLHTLTLKGDCSFKRLVECDGEGLLELRQLNMDTTCDEFTELPATFTTLNHLTSLQIHAPKLSSLPEALGALSRLRKLNLSNCSSLTHLPASLTQLSCLHELNVSNTSIRLLPPGLTQLSRLRRLDVHSCKHLEALPDDICELRMLDHLSTRWCDEVQHRRCLSHS